MPIPNPVAFTMFNTPIMWYGIIVTMGIIVGAAICCYRAPKHNLTCDRLLDFIIICVPSAIVGARLYYIIFNWSLYQGDILSMINIRHGGLAIHGGLIAGFGVALILCYKWKVMPLNIMDLAAPSVAIGQAIGRWGNYFNSEAHGGPTDLPWAVTVDGATYHPTFLYESIWCFILFVVLLQIDKHRKFQGQIICLYGVLYSVERFFVEAIRTDSLMIGPLKQAQVISLVIFIICLCVYIYLARRNKNECK